MKTTGDGFMLVFDSARTGLECAAAIQAEMAERTVAVRIGVHSGEAVQADGDFFGHHVNLAARVAGAAGAGEVLVSDIVHQLTSTAGDLEFGPARAVHLKGIEGPVRLHPLRAAGGVTVVDGGRVAPAVAPRAVFRREGDYWTVSFAGETARLKDTKGMRHLAALLACPGTERHVLDLVGAGGAGGAGGDAGPVLDAAAKDAYRRRLADLNAERDEAVAFNDPARAERAEAEIDSITDELKAAVGLGGRDRVASSASERARVSVSRAVKTAMARIDEALPALGSHLAATVRTGTFCSYSPDPRAPFTWDL